MPQDTQFAEVNGQRIAYQVQGDGPPVLLLHGFPQTRAMWDGLCARLAQRYTCVTADLRGYGASSKPEGVENYRFREMAADQMALMTHLGFETFHLVGHDRGARTAHRAALDHPARLRSLTLMDIVPTHLLLSALHKDVANAYYHWFFLAQPAPFPETMITHDPDAYYESCLSGWNGGSMAGFSPHALAAYRRAWQDPACRRAMCDDYRAAITLDFEDDSADLDRSVGCPSLVLYGGDGAMTRAYDVPATWADRLSNMQSAALPGGHFFVDAHPEMTADILACFLDETSA